MLTLSNAATLRPMKTLFTLVLILSSTSSFAASLQDVTANAKQLSTSSETCSQRYVGIFTMTTQFGAALVVAQIAAKEAAEKGDTAKVEELKKALEEAQTQVAEAVGTFGAECVK